MKRKSIISYEFLIGLVLSAIALFFIYKFFTQAFFNNFTDLDVAKINAENLKNFIEYTYKTDKRGCFYLYKLYQKQYYPNDDNAYYYGIKDNVIYILKDYNKLIFKTFKGFLDIPEPEKDFDSLKNIFKGTRIKSYPFNVDKDSFSVSIIKEDDFFDDILNIFSSSSKEFETDPNSIHKYLFLKYNGDRFNVYSFYYDKKLKEYNYKEFNQRYLYLYKTPDGKVKFYLTDDESFELYAKNNLCELKDYNLRKFLKILTDFDNFDFLNNEVTLKGFCNKELIWNVNLPNYFKCVNCNANICNSKSTIYDKYKCIIINLDTIFGTDCGDIAYSLKRININKKLDLNKIGLKIVRTLKTDEKKEIINETSNLYKELKSKIINTNWNLNKKYLGYYKCNIDGKNYYFISSDKIYFWEGDFKNKDNLNALNLKYCKDKYFVYNRNSVGLIKDVYYAGNLLDSSVIKCNKLKENGLYEYDSPLVKLTSEFLIVKLNDEICPLFIK